MNPTMPRALEVIDWGTVSYGEALRRQEALVAERVRNTCPDRLILVEHPPVVTVGRSGGRDDLRVPEAALRRQGIAVHYVDRGGRATFHGPGQLVAYPIVKLRVRDVHAYLQRVLETVCAVIRGYGLTPQLQKGSPGVWVNGAKIASVGIAVRKWVTYHGVALNVCTDPAWFRWIVPCGNAGETITSMERELERPVSMEDVKQDLARCFREVFRHTPRAETRTSPRAYRQPCTSHEFRSVGLRPEGRAVGGPWPRRDHGR